MRDEFDKLARQHKLNTSTVKILAHALQEGNGTIGPFNHPESSSPPW